MHCIINIFISVLFYILTEAILHQKNFEFFDLLD